MTTKTIYGKGAVVDGCVEGELVISHESISLLGGFDPETGKIVEKGHELEGVSIADKILVAYGEKGSSAGPFTLMNAKSLGNAPSGIILGYIGAIIISGAMESDIPTIRVDKKDLKYLKTGMYAKMTVKSGKGIIEVSDSK